MPKPSAPEAIAPHPLRRYAYLYIAAGVIYVVLAAFLLFGIHHTNVPLLAVCVLLSTWFIGRGLYSRSIGAGVQLINRAYNLVSTGRLREAEALLDIAEASSRIRYIRQVIATQRALIAMRRGDISGGMAHADAAIATPLGMNGRDGQRIQRVGARAIRALLRAAAGEREGALADIEEVRADPLATVEPLARVEVARAVLLEKSGDREALRAHLTRERRLLLEFSHPRERAIVRAYQRLLKAPKASAYRTSAPREEEAPEEPALADWAAKIAPAAAPFVRAPSARRAPGSAESAALEAVDPAARAAAESRLKGSKAKAWRRILMLWVVAVVTGIGAWQLFTPSHRAPVDMDDDLPPPSALVEALPMLLGVGFFVFAIGLIIVRARRANALAKRLIEVSVYRARSDNEATTRALTELAGSKPFLVAAQANLMLAEDAERRVEIPAALAACEAGLARLSNDGARAVASDMILPGLLAERAYLFVAADRPADARAELELLEKRHPAYAFLDRAKLRVALLQKARQEDLTAAAELAEHTADLPLNARDELLADLVRLAAAKGSASQAEVARLREELAIDAGARRWLEAMAPAVLPAFQQAVEAEVAVEAEAAAASASENEALAEAEAAREAEGGRLARA